VSRRIIKNSRNNILGSAFAFISAHPRYPWLKNLLYSGLCENSGGPRRLDHTLHVLEIPVQFVHSCANAVIVEQPCHLRSAARSRRYDCRVLRPPDQRANDNPILNPSSDAHKPAVPVCRSFGRQALFDADCFEVVGVELIRFFNSSYCTRSVVLLNQHFCCFTTDARIIG
jgi:hypothetical protein